MKSETRRKPPSSRRRASAQTAIRTGRPPRELEGEVDERILAAARTVFLNRGFAGASVEEIAETARAGKATIYARHPNKEALFIAAMLRDVANTLHFDYREPCGGTFEDRFANVGNAILHRSLRAETLDCLRAVIAEARRFPDLAAKASEVARESVIQSLARSFGDFVNANDETGWINLAPEQLASTARIFLELVVVPMMLRGMMGENIDALKAEIPHQIKSRLKFFFAACRHGGLEKSSTQDN